jgi:hypothetical protein
MGGVRVGAVGRGVDGVVMCVCGVDMGWLDGVCTNGLSRASARSSRTLVRGRGRGQSGRGWYGRGWSRRGDSEFDVGAAGVGMVGVGVAGIGTS